MDDLLNIYICIIAPLLLMFFMLKNDSKKLNLFLILGMTACLTASYVNMYLVGLTGFSRIQSTYYITPICEETIKALPVLLYVLIIKPKSENVISASMAVGIGFATLENCYYIMLDGARDLVFLLMRGFATGIMHGMCTAVIGFGLAFVFNQKNLAFTGTFGLLCSAITYHATYNLLVSSRGIMENIGIYMPIATAAFALAVIYKPYNKLRISRRHHARHADKNRRQHAQHACSNHYNTVHHRNRENIEIASNVSLETIVKHNIFLW
jgi:RsiW-degrading membrane proteinase PrsW (M82 family)